MKKDWLKIPTTYSKTVTEAVALILTYHCVRAAFPYKNKSTLIATFRSSGKNESFGIPRTAKYFEWFVFIAVLPTRNCVNPIFIFCSFAQRSFCFVLMVKDKATASVRTFPQKWFKSSIHDDGYHNVWRHKWFKTLLNHVNIHVIIMSLFVVTN